MAKTTKRKPRKRKPRKRTKRQIEASSKKRRERACALYGKAVVDFHNARADDDNFKVAFGEATALLKKLRSFYVSHCSR